MRSRAKILVAAFVLAFALSDGVLTALAAETDPSGQTGQTVQTEQAGQEGQTQQTEQVGQTEQTEAALPLSPAEPSDKRGLQSEDGCLYYFKSNGFLYTGWKKVKKKIYYFRVTATPDAPRGSAVTGFEQIGSYRYYFNEEGVLQTGWQTVGSKRYYCEPTGSYGKIGRIYTGLQKIDKKRYYFDETGKMHTGWVLYKNKRYFFTKKKSSVSYGAAYTGWHTISKERYYFSSKGVMKKSCWISGKYYVDADGKMLKSCVTPDGYLLDSKGVKGKLANGFVKIGGKTYYYSSGKMVTGLKKIKGKRYYFKANGVRKSKGWVTVKGNKYYIKDSVVQTGWVVCDGKRYYFASNGKMVKNKVVDGIQIGEDGTSSVSVLLIAGHGQGDAGASSTCASVYYREDLLTRELTTLIYKQLTSIAPGLNVVMYDQNYDCYQVMSGKKAGPKPDLKLYDYVLEVHFNATDNPLKDPNGNGACKGTSMYVNASKADTKIDEQIVAAVAKAGGLPIWGGGTGISRSAGLFNARTCQAQGVSYGLLETLFIDDYDDIKVYNKSKKAMAKAVATVIKNYFSV